jgi:arginine/lysine/ornithine decarboxylase
MTLLELLQTYSQSDALPMHMPGHKRNTALFPYLETLGAALDITEIDSFGNLHAPEGILAERMTQAARLWGSKQAWWLVGGSTCGLLAAIDAATNAGDKVLLGRNCHKSVYNACMLCHLETAYIQPHSFPHHCFADIITPQQVEQALAEHPDTRLVVLTSPTYEGLTSDILAISKIVHAHNAVLLVDEAHGGHLGFDNHFPTSAVKLGADMVVQSLHKTLPSLTQTALLHL